MQLKELSLMMNTSEKLVINHLQLIIQFLRPVIEATSASLNKKRKAEFLLRPINQNNSNYVRNDLMPSIPSKSRHISKKIKLN